MAAGKKVRCPQCGFKIKQHICPYCDINTEQVVYGSNTKAKTLLKQNLKENVLYTTSLPYDISKLKMLWLTIFLGVFGANSFHVGRKGRGWFVLISFFSGFILTYLNLFHIDNILFSNIATFAAFFTIIAIFMWLSDIVAVLFNKFNYPVVLATEEEIAKRQQDINQSIQQLKQSSPKKGK